MDEGEGKPVVQAGLGGQGEANLVFTALTRRADLDIAGEHGIGWRERRSK